MSDLVIVARFYDLTEAQVACSYLRAHGVTVELGEANLQEVNPPITWALGGCRLLVPEEEASTAKALLAAAEANRARCPACNSTRLGLVIADLATVLVGGVTLALAAVPPLLGRRRVYHCLDCEHCWDPNAEEGDELPA